MANPLKALKALNEHFKYNHQLATTMQELLTPEDRKIISSWLDKLFEMDSTPDEMIVRSDYMWFILLMMQNRKISEPFRKMPPGELKPLKSFLPLQVYEEVLLANESNMPYIHEIHKEFDYDPTRTITESTSYDSNK